MRSLAPAKINLALHVVGQRADGYHLLDSLVAFADIGDRLSVSTHTGETLQAGPDLTLSGPFCDGLLPGDDNLILRAARLALAAIADSDLDDNHSTEPSGSALSCHMACDLAFHLEKELPIASGIGGGSADAAAALRLMSATGVGFSEDHLLALAARLGADVPMCLHSRAARSQGIGDQLSPLEAFPHCPIVLINPGLEVSTPRVFKALRAKANAPLPALPQMGFQELPHLLDWLRETRNDLEPPACALVPDIKKMLDALAATAGCAIARMSGSGATTFGLYPTTGAAETAAISLAHQFPKAWVRHGTLSKQPRLDLPTQAVR